MDDATREKKRAQQQARRLEALRGIAGSDDPTCVCCSEHRIWALTFDHRNGGGRQHRAGNGHAPTVQLVRQERRARGEWPTDRYQVLCATCNHGRRVSPDGICPHQREEVKKKMTTNELTKIGGTIARVFLAAVLAQFIAQGGDVFTIDGDGLRTIISAGVAAAAVAAFNWLNPGDHRYGLKG